MMRLKLEKIEETKPRAEPDNEPDMETWFAPRCDQRKEERDEQSAHEQDRRGHEKTS
jgi:hypothetical protein